MGFSVVVHCGTYKTGSSSIQNTLYENKRYLLEKYGILYPETGLRKDKAIGMRHTKFPFAKEGVELDTLLDNLRREVLEASCSGHLKKVVISSEAWSHPGMAWKVKYLIDLFNDLGASDVVAILYIRNLYDYTRRHYREFTFRHGNELKIGSYVSKKIKVFDYNLLVKNLKKFFGEGLVVRGYDEINSVLSDFISFLGLSEKELVKERKKFNKGQDSVTCELVRLFSPIVKSRHKIPTSYDLETFYGVSFSGLISEPLDELSFGFLSDDYVYRFSELSGWSLEESRILFKDQMVECKSIYNISEVLTSMGMGLMRA